MDVQNEPMNQTAEAAAEWYAVSTHFADLVFRHFVGDDYDRSIPHIHDVYQRYGHQKEHLEYALSTNVRGSDVLRKLRESALLPEKLDGRYLDVGCAYGGFLHAFASAGFTVNGVEINPQAADLGRANLHHLGDDCSIAVGDFLDIYADEGPGQFDVITCNDVIEHVSDPRACLSKIYSLLAPGGVAYLETVNKRSVVNVAADIHFGLFGISLLDHHSASAAYRQVSGWHEYQVSDFFLPEWYLSVCRMLGGKPETIASDRQWDATKSITDLFAAYGTWESGASSKVDVFLQHQIRSNFFSFCAEMFAARKQAHDTGDESTFIASWVDPVIRFAVRKPAA